MTLERPKLRRKNNYDSVGKTWIITSSILRAVNFISRIINVKSVNKSAERIPSFVWKVGITELLLLLSLLVLTIKLNLWLTAPRGTTPVN